MGALAATLLGLLAAGAFLGLYLWTGARYLESLRDLPLEIRQGELSRWLWPRD